MNGREVLKETESFLNRQVENVRDRESFVAHAQRLAVESLSLARLAGDEQIGQKVHLQPLNAVALTLFAAATGNVEAEAAGFEAELFRFLCSGKHFADLIEGAGVCRRTGSGRASERCLID